MQSVHITSKIASSNPAVGEVYSLEHYVIEFVSDLRQVCCFPGTPFSSANKTDRHIFNWNIAESGIKNHNTNLSPTKMYVYSPTVIITHKW